MISILSLVTSVKDYIEVVHQLVHAESSSIINRYDDLGALITYILLLVKNFYSNIINLNWLQNLNNLSIIIPDISSSMISEISILDGFFHNIFNFVDISQSYGEKNILTSSFEKFSIGLINSLFLWLPTSTAHIITLRRFLVQNLEAGYIAGLGTLTGSILWISCIIFGCRFFIIPWLSFDIFRYILGFVLLLKYMWDSQNERRMVLKDLSKQKIFLLNFLLALTEQTNIYPFLSNVSIGPESSIIESFPATNYGEFLSVHGCYIFGLILGSLSLLHLTCWFLESYAFQIYMWIIASFKVSTGVYYKTLNLTFLYLTMLFAISSIPYYSLDYPLTSPVGLVSNDQMLEQISFVEMSFLNGQGSDENTRRNRGRHGRKERWKRRLRKYRTFDTTSFDNGTYDFFTIEDLNYGFDRFWLRRKMRNHRIRYRFFSDSWMRSFKKQLAKTGLESYDIPRREFFRVLFEQAYHPTFHEYTKIPNQTKLNLINAGKIKPVQNSNHFLKIDKKEKLIKNTYTINKTLLPKVQSISMLRKFIRKLDTRIKLSEIIEENRNNSLVFTLGRFAARGNTSSPEHHAFPKDESNQFLLKQNKSILKNNVYSKRWKEIFSKFEHEYKQQNNSQLKGFLNHFYKNAFKTNNKKNKINYPEQELIASKNQLKPQIDFLKKENSKKNLSKKDIEILRYRSMLKETEQTSSLVNIFNSKVLLHPIKFYLQKQKAFERKLRYYTPTIFRNFSVGNNASHFRINMKRYFHYYKPTLRWERTMKIGTLRQARRKTPRKPKKIEMLQREIKTNSNLFNKKKTNQLVGVAFPKDEPGVAFPKDEPGYASPFGARMGYPGQPKVDPVTLAALRLPPSLRSLPEAQANLSQLSSSSIDSLDPEAKKINKKQLIKETRLKKPTHNYSVIGRHITRYRYEIYKDVLQHWYYSPFNRLLLQFDIDSFIKRQPKTHFLTKNEENLLHLRRFLLSEHYNTLRWYTYMEHYRSMKTKIGGTKSFASGPYYQQFKGTFKKIRHLFAITPIQSISNQSNLSSNDRIQFLKKTPKKDLHSQSYMLAKPNLLGRLVNPAMMGLENFARLPFFILVRDKVKGNASHQKLQMGYPGQPIYNKGNSNKKINDLSVLKFDQFLFNERLNNNKNKLQNNLILHEELLTDLVNLSPVLAQDLVTQTTNLMGNYIEQSKPATNQYIKNLIAKKDYSEFTKFLIKGYKNGENSLNNNNFLISSEQNSLRTHTNKFNLNALNKIHLKEFLKKKTSFNQDLWFKLLKKWKKKINNQSALKEYLIRRFDWRQIRKQTKEKSILVNLKRLEGLLVKKKQNINKLLIKNKNSVNKNYFLFNSLNKNKKNNFQINNITSGLNKAVVEGILNIKNIDLKTKKKQELQNNSFIKENLVNKVLVKEKNTFENSLNSLAKIAMQLENKKVIKDSKTFRPNLTNKSNFLKTSYILEFYPTKIKNYKEKILSFFNLLKPIKEKTFKNWQKRAIVNNPQSKATINRFVAKRKKRKRKKNAKIKNNHKNYVAPSGKFINNNDFNFSIIEKNILRKKRTFKKTSLSKKNNLNNTKFRKKIKSFKEILKKNKFIFLGRKKTNKLKTNSSIKKLIKKIFSKFSLNFKRKKRIQRRSFIPQYRGTFQKRPIIQWDKAMIYGKMLHARMANLHKIRINFLKKNREYTIQDYNLLVDKENFVKPDVFDRTKLFSLPKLRNRSLKLKRHYAWKRRHSAGWYAAQKSRKRKRYVLGKMKRLSKQLKQIKSKSQFQIWWFTQFLSSLKATTDSIWLVEQKREINTLLNNVKNKLVNVSDGSFNKSLENSNNKLLQKNSFVSGNASLQMGYPGQPKVGPAQQTSEKQTSEQQTSEQQTSEQQTSEQQTSEQHTLAALSYASHPEHQNLLKIGNLNFKPLSMINSTLLKLPSDVDKFGNLPLIQINHENLISNQVKDPIINKNNVFETKNLIGQLSENLLLSGISNQEKPFQFMESKFMVNTNPLPFYAGWDESLRKFIITNRFLSRRDSGYIFRINKDLSTPLNRFDLLSTKAKSNSSLKENFNGLSQTLNQYQENKQASLEPEIQEFTSAPFKGMHVATILYWQVPFSTFAPDQFFTLGIDGFAPINWRKFKFRHTILKTWLYQTQNSIIKKTHPILIKQKTSLKTSNNFDNNLTKNLVYKIKEKNYFYNNFYNSNINKTNVKNRKTRTHYIKKRYKRVKRRLSRSFPGGQQLSKVLPIHYTAIFFRRSRLPRDRYFKRRLTTFKKTTKIKTIQINSINQNSKTINNLDFTLRKRVKPKRKFHQKRMFNSGSEIRVKRLKFIGEKTDSLRWRPFSLRKLNKQKNKSIEEILKEQLAAIRLKNQKNRYGNLKKKKNVSYIKPLRRRIQRQTINPSFKYAPKTGGILWPGSYFELESVKAPNLNIGVSVENNQDKTKLKLNQNLNTEKRNLNNLSNKNILKKRKIKKQKRPSLQGWSKQIRKLNYEKHNIKVLKKKLKKSYHFNKTKEKIKQLNLIL